MPPRKRTQSAPNPEPVEAVTPLNHIDNEPNTEPPVETETKPRRSDLQKVKKPCTACFPDGWPAQSFAVGCEHGSWTRD